MLLSKSCVKPRSKPDERGRLLGRVVSAARRTLLLLPVVLLMAGAEAPGPAAASTRPSPHYSLRYIFRSDKAPRSAVAAGWNLIDVSSKERADELPAGSRAL